MRYLVAVTKIQEAVILAAGRGTRMRELTGDSGFTAFLRKLGAILTSEAKDLTVIQIEGGVNARCKSG
jgi:choline kinase